MFEISSMVNLFSESRLLIYSNRSVCSFVNDCSRSLESVSRCFVMLLRADVCSFDNSFFLDFNSTIFSPQASFMSSSAFWIFFLVTALGVKTSRIFPLLLIRSAISRSLLSDLINRADVSRVSFSSGARICSVSDNPSCNRRSQFVWSSISIAIRTSFGGSSAFSFRISCAFFEICSRKPLISEFVFNSSPSGNSFRFPSRGDILPRRARSSVLNFPTR